ncbi:hypothetical protein PoB_004015100 [Plakobranchus ocellatus]|uniref:Uncharacterized protein n=1 Tax=Plakobranchus ocellatus TaxID=259542 RepID=A0AAV4AR67_9GAST|nr:hypothetical protein PoB_004015100 [Plakobranchus ocellatus]
MPTHGGLRPPHPSHTPRASHRTTRRPRTSPGYHQTIPRPVSVQQAVNAEDQAVPDDDEEEHIELLEYEWPDLPPIPSMKDAVSRSRVSKGISYLLPVDKGRNSINNRFRTDLRAMFQEPYASDDLQYDDNRVKLSAKVHFLSNSADTRWTPQLLRAIPTQLNADSDAVRKLYVHSAPSGGRGGVGIDPGKLRKRSNLYLPVKASKAQVSPEIIKLREEAATIIKQGLTYDEDGSPGMADDRRRPALNGTKTIATLGGAEAQHPRFLPSNSHQQSQIQELHAGNQNWSETGLASIGNLDTSTDGHGIGLLSTFGGGYLQDSLGTSVLNPKLQNVRSQQQIFSNYDELRRAQAPRPVIPKEIESPFLSPDHNQNIWEWLHYGESMSEFDYFLSVCG